METKRWDVCISKKKFQNLKKDERFLRILTLSRFVNALRFCQEPIIAARQKDTPSASRQSINSFLFASSVLFEGLKIARSLGKHFKDMDVFKKGLGVLLKDKMTKRLMGGSLKVMRNRFVFHFDQDVVEKALENFKPTSYNFATGYGKATGELYYGLADELSVNYLLNIDCKKSDPELKISFQELVQDTTDLMIKFSDAAERLIAEVLVEMGWILKKPKITIQ